MILQIVLIDATEQPIERPQKNNVFTTVAKRHTQKAQLIINQQTQEIIATAFAKGSKHDFQLFKDSHVVISEHISSLADSGYQGLYHLHKNSQTPLKKSKCCPLTKEQKMSNHKLSRKRIRIENVICCLKLFRILSERYRNRRKRYSLRFNLIAAIYNFQLIMTP